MSSRAPVVSVTHHPAPVDLNDIALFVEVVDAGGFSAAARRLRSPKSSVSRGVLRLEKALGARLLHRSTRAVSLTDVGQAYYTHAQIALRDLKQATRTVVDAPLIPRGTLRVSAPTDVGAEVLPVMVAAFVTRYPEVSVEVELSAQDIDLVEGRFDVAVRSGEVRDLSLVVRKLQQMNFRLYGSPSYLNRFGTPETIEDLPSRSFVLFRPTNGVNVWHLRCGNEERERSVTVRGSVTSNDLSFVRRAAVAGSGLALLPGLVGRELVARGELAPVLPDWWAAGPPLLLVLPTRQQLPAKVRAFCDFLLQFFPQDHEPKAPQKGNAITIAVPR